jgi:hypothetical protein
MDAARVFSDGMIFRYSPGAVSSYLRITRCAQCGNIFPLDKKTFSGEAGWLRDHLAEGAYKPARDEWKDAAAAKFLTIDEYFTVLAVSQCNKEDEIYIRVRIWCAFHQKMIDALIETKRAGGEVDIDRYKRRGVEYLLKKIKLTTIHYTMDEADRVLYEQNIRALLVLLDGLSAGKKILIAELHRNIGEFDECVKIIDTIGDEKYRVFLGQMKEECVKRNPCVFIVRRFW